jgi:hypothetical protein
MAADRKAPLLAAEGSVLFLKTVSSALRNVDSSSGAIGSAVNRAIEALVPIITQAPVDGAARRQWLRWRTTRSCGLRAMLSRNWRWSNSAA